MLFILGAHTDDKGTQLEQMGQDMLASRGYRNLTLNAVGPGAAEYDVTGEREVLATTGAQPLFVLGECKAWQDPVNMDAWQKFLGKIFTEQVRRGTPIQGIFMALSGVNGNVASSYDELKMRGLEVELIRNTELEEFLGRHYNVIDIKQTVHALGKYTTRRVLSVDLCYYGRACYRLVRFDSDYYTLLDASGEPLRGEELEKIRKLVDAAPAPGKYLDLPAEAEAQKRFLLSKKYVLSCLMRDGGQTMVSELERGEPAAEADFSTAEIQDALSSLSATGWIEVAGGEARFTNVDAEGRCDHFIPIVRFWIEGPILPGSYLTGLRSAFYHRHIDERLLEQVSSIQEGLPFPQEDKDALIWVLKLSPSALLNALTKQQLITEGRQPLRDNELINNTDRNIFYDILSQLLAHDYERLILGMYFWECGVREIELSRGIVVKGSGGVLARLESRVRHAKPPSNTNLGILPVIVPNDSPEPWEDGYL